VVAPSTLHDRTQDRTDDGDGDRGDRGAPVPGLVLVSVGSRATLEVLPLEDGALELGREEGLAGRVDDQRMSRRHARVRQDGRAFLVEDLRSRNGSAVDGVAVAGTRRAEDGAVLRLGDSLLLARGDVRPFRRVRPPLDAEPVVGAALGEALAAVAALARGSEALHITGESGCGKELAARAFHHRGPRSAGPFVAINCAAVPEGVAERLLFGARKGAFSGATADVEGYLQAAHGGTLFLDEVAELERSVQAKLLRVLETREVLALGASRAQTVSLRVCSATHRDLREEVAAGRFREDLYYRLGSPQVAIPPLRERREELPWLLQRAVRGVHPSLAPHPSLLEACLLRPWPGNVREVLTEARAAAQRCLAEEHPRVELRHLSPSAGLPFARPRQAPPAPGALDREALEAALRDAQGNISAAARALGLHRTQLRRLLERHGIARPDTDPA
jgi:transcriptional regulator of acetoin/glycerol metabolism